MSTSPPLPPPDILTPLNATQLVDLARAHGLGAGTSVDIDALATLTDQARSTVYKHVARDPSDPFPLIVSAGYRALLATLPPKA